MLKLSVLKLLFLFFKLNPANNLKEFISEYYLICALKAFPSFHPKHCRKYFSNYVLYYRVAFIKLYHELSILTFNNNDVCYNMTLVITCVVCTVCIAFLNNKAIFKVVFHFLCSRVLWTRRQCQLIISHKSCPGNSHIQEQKQPTYGIEQMHIGYFPYRTSCRHRN